MNHDCRRKNALRRWQERLFVSALLSLLIAPAVWADAFHQYSLAGSFELPAGTDRFDALPDGRLLIIVGDVLHIETSVGTRQFEEFGTLPNADIPSFGVAFFEISPDGTKVAVGNNGGVVFPNYEVGVFDLSDPPNLSGTWLAANHFLAGWIDNRHLALTAGDFGSPAFVSFLDTLSANRGSPVNPVVIDGIGGASSGIAFDQAGNLFTGNGFEGAGPSGTGAIKAFDKAAWMAAWTGGTPLDFENEGTLVIDILSADTLGFDADGNLHVGGGDGDMHSDFAALVAGSAIAAALGGQGPVDAEDSSVVRRFDPDTDNDFNFYAVGRNAVADEMYIRNFAGSTVYVYRAACVPLPAASPFADTVWAYEPAPGQFVNNPKFNDPTVALGPPDGLGTNDGNVSSIVSLGGFGGSITLAFDHMVEDDPRNAFGVDAIVFGNAVWVDGDPERHWAECAVVEISLDVNCDLLPNDPWYLIPGSHILDPDDQFFLQVWDDDPGTPVPPDNLSWIPAGQTGTWETTGYLLDGDLFGPLVVENPLAGGDLEGIFGYGDYTPTLVLGDLDADNLVDDATITPESFYTTPDDPMTVGITRGSGGGDAFDIAWAIDPDTGESAELPGFHFIRLTSGVNVLTNLGEKSPEIDGVADVAPDPFGDADQDGDIDLFDVAELMICFQSGDSSSDSCALLDFDDNQSIDLEDFRALVPRMTGPA
ncbi:MAG: hypothetical protein IIC51_05865 [Planctomycetes bacterium]|nr:hypothetical protein [Planctomycetota bacterium]